MNSIWNETSCCHIFSGISSYEPYRHHKGKLNGGRYLHLFKPSKVSSTIQTKTWSIEFLRSCKDFSKFEPLIFELFWKMPKVTFFLAFCCQSGNSVLTKRLWRHQSLTSFRRLLKTGTPIFEYVRYCGFDPGKKHTQFFREMTIFDVLHQDSVLTWQYGLATTFKIRIKPRKMIQSGLELTSFCRVTLQLRTISIVAVHLCHNTQFTNKQYHFKKMA